MKEGIQKLQLFPTRREQSALDRLNVQEGMRAMDIQEFLRFWNDFADGRGSVLQILPGPELYVP